MRYSGSRSTLLTTIWFRLFVTDVFKDVEKVASIGHLHYEVILLPRPESFRTLRSCANQGFCYRNLTGITKLKYERKNEKDSGRNSKMTSSCKWPSMVEEIVLPNNQM